MQPLTTAELELLMPVLMSSDWRGSKTGIQRADADALAWLVGARLYADQYLSARHYWEPVRETWWCRCYFKSVERNAEGDPISAVELGFFGPLETFVWIRTGRTFVTPLVKPAGDMRMGAIDHLHPIDDYKLAALREEIQTIRNAKREIPTA